MNLHSSTSVAIALPAFLSPSFSTDARQGAGFRPLGTERRDLSIDFAEENRARLITDILECCAVDPRGVLPSGLFENISIGKRLECLVRLAAGDSGSAISVPFRCDSCNEELQLEFTIDEIAEQQRDADNTENVEFEINGRMFAFRHPLASDQERWSLMEFADEDDAAKVMIETLAEQVLNVKKLNDKDFAMIEQAIADSDPLVNFVVKTKCSACGAESTIDVDIGEVALGLLRSQQQRLLYTVHRLATNYHWSEEEIFEIPHWRRMRYQDLIDATTIR